MLAGGVMGVTSLDNLDNLTLYFAQKKLVVVNQLTYGD